MSGSRWARTPKAGEGEARVEPGDARGEGVSAESFSEVLRRYFHRAGSSVTQLAYRSWLDIGYVSRLLSQNCDPLNPRLPVGSKAKQPSRDAVIRLGLGLGLEIHELDELLLAAGYAPLVR